jgi:hypothetical protein
MRSHSAARPQTSVNKDQRSKEALKAKLAYEWKNIYKYLVRMDIAEKGTISCYNFRVCAE